MTRDALAIRAILVDIEGTTTPISFVYDVLFPYAEARLAAACQRAADEPAFATAVDQLRREHRQEPAENSPPEFGDGSSYGRWLMRQDRKSTGLKSLQGLIWESGYHDGEIRSQVFADVPAALAAWQQAGLRLRVYSSGSILAQKLLFAHSEHGDLTPFFECYHDTTTGPKKEADSYRRIAADFALPAADILFLSDTPAELAAASEAGLRTGLLVRPGNPPVDPHPYAVYRDFTEIACRLES